MKIKIEITGRDGIRDLRACVYKGCQDTKVLLPEGEVIPTQDKLVILPGGAAVVSAGFRMGLEDGWEAQIRPRSGNSIKGLMVANSPGTIDSGYRGVVCVILRNLGPAPVVIHDGDKIAQMVIQKIPDVELEEVQSLSLDTDRGESGFGSTGSISTESPV